jgi:FkbM family methyltransferase
MQQTRRRGYTAMKAVRRGICAIVLISVAVYVIRTISSSERASLAFGDCQLQSDHFATQLLWRAMPGKNHADFDALKRLCQAFRDSGLSGPDSTVLVGGTNAGQLSESFLGYCPDLTFHGFEIQREYFLNTSRALERFPRAHMHNVGWSEQASQNVAIGGFGGKAGLYDPKGQRGWTLNGETASTVAIADWLQSRGISNVTYAVIDTEGNEPKVLRGMRLENIKNRRKLPLFQFELGGTWAQNDKRHNGDPWTQVDAALHLEKLGYELFLTHGHRWLHVESDFFQVENNPATDEEGFGPFVQGNLLAMHATFTPRLLRQLILQDATFVQRTRKC